MFMTQEIFFWGGGTCIIAQRLHRIFCTMRSMVKIKKGCFTGCTVLLPLINTLTPTLVIWAYFSKFEICTRSCGYITSDKKTTYEKVAWVKVLIIVLWYKKLSKVAQRSKSHISNYDAVLWCGFPLLKTPITRTGSLSAQDYHTRLLTKLSLRAPKCTMEEKSWVMDGKSLSFQWQQKRLKKWAESEIIAPRNPENLFKFSKQLSKAVHYIGETIRLDPTLARVKGQTGLLYKVTYSKQITGWTNY